MPWARTGANQIVAPFSSVTFQLLRRSPSALAAPCASRPPGLLRPRALAGSSLSLSLFCAQTKKEETTKTRKAKHEHSFRRRTKGSTLFVPILRSFQKGQHSLCANPSPKGGVPHWQMLKYTGRVTHSPVCSVIVVVVVTSIVVVGVVVGVRSGARNAG